MNRTFWKQLWYLLIAALVGLVIVALLLIPSSLIIGSIGSLVDGVDSMVAVLHVTQWLQTIFLMFIPPLLWCKIMMKKEPFSAFGFKNPGWKAIFMTLLIVVVSIPFLDLITVLNAKIPLPDSIEASMREMQELNENAIQQLIGINGFWGWVELILLMSVGTAIAEETMFRGGLLEVFRLSTLNKHVVALIIGFIFSAIHFDIYGFVPRWLLGSFFCYLVFWTGSIWPSILAHALNNLIALLQYKLIGVQSADDVEFSFSWPIMLLSILATALLVYSFERVISVQKQ